MLDAIERQLYDPSRRRAAAKSADEKAGDADLESGEVSPPPTPGTARSVAERTRFETASPRPVSHASSPAGARPDGMERRARRRHSNVSDLYVVSTTAVPRATIAPRSGRST